MKYLITIIFACLFLVGNGQVSNLNYYGWYNLRSDISEFRKPQYVEGRYFTTIQLLEFGWNFPRNYLIEFDQKGIINQHLVYKKDSQGEKIDFLGLGTQNEKLVGYYEQEQGERSLLYQSVIDTRDFSIQRGKTKIMSGEINRNKPSPILGDLNGKGAIENKYFGERLYAFIDLPGTNKTLILRRAPGKMADVPEISFVLMNQNSEAVMDGKFKFLGSNRHTEIVDIDIDEADNLYFLTSTRNGSEQDYALTIYDEKLGDDRTVKLRDQRYIQALQLAVNQGNMMFAGFASEKRGTRKWDLIASTLGPEEKSISRFKTLEELTFDQDDIIDIKNAGDAFALIAKSFRASNYESSANPRQVRTRNFTPRETRDTKIIGLNKEGEVQWDHLIPNYVRAEVFTFDAYEEGYNHILYDNYLYLEEKDKLIVIFPMNPLNDRKPRKNGKSRSVMRGSKKRFGVKAMTFGTNGLVSEKIISEGQNVITPIPFYTQEGQDGKYFMLGSRFRGGAFGIGTLEIK